MIKSNASLDDATKTDYNTKYAIDNIINVFLTHMRSLHKDIYDDTNGYNKKDSDNAHKKSVFDSQIKTSLKMLSDTQGTNTKKITRESTDDELEYLFQAFKNFKVKVDANTNYLVNVIETISNQLNNTEAKVKLYSVDQNTKLEFTHEPSKKLKETSILKAKVDKNDEIDGVKILHQANQTARERFVLTYSTNIFVLGIVYFLLSNITKK